MSLQRLHLSWKDHNGTLVVVFENLLKRNALVDCTLAAEGRYLKAHKVVLSACSSYFELLFSQESEKNPIVILKDVKFQELEAAVNYMYRGEVEVCEDRLAAFLEVADSLQIKGLGSEERAQDLREMSPTVKSPKVAVPPKSHSRKDVSLSQSENTEEISIILDSDKNSNESSAHQQLPHRETSGSFPVPSSLPMASSFNIASTSASILARAEIHHDGELLENYQCSSSSVSAFPSGDCVPPDVNTVIKIEPATDMYFHEKSDESERDFEDVTVMEGQEDWDDSNIQSVGDDQATNSHDPGYSMAHMKTEESSSEHISSGPAMEHISSEDATWEHGSAGSGEGPHFASIFLKEQRPDVNPDPNPGPGPVPGPTPGPAPGNGPGTSSAPSRQGCAGSARVEAATVAPRGCRFQCSHCGYATNINTNWARHERVHTREKPFKCTVCPHATTNFSNLIEHMRKHTKGKPCKCPVCSHTTMKFSDLKVHMLKHIEEKPYKCTVCAHATRYFSDLRVHMRKHSGEKPFKCTICPYAAAQRARLNVHMRTHTGEKPYKCTICTYATARVDHLTVHMRQHTGEKPFQCMMCRYASTNVSNLKVHVWKRHGKSL